MSWVLPVRLQFISVMYPRKEVDADPVWKYEELPPVALIKSLRLEPAAINQSEFSRAEWFWSRRPKLISESVSFFFLYLTIAVCLFYLVPDSIWWLLLWILAGAGCASIDHIRLNRWRNEYESSIKGIVAHLSERK
jgi:hypothetical protein